jgi:hypothetical protein
MGTKYEEHKKKRIKELHQRMNKFRKMSLELNKSKD